MFYDSGGSEGNYSNGENKTMVFISANGHRLRFDFQSFQVESSWDKFKIYDGPNINSPFIGEFSGSNTPGVIVSTGTSLTFVFTSDGSTNYSGWAAVISCTTPALVEYPMSTGTVTTCSALFTDSGGPNGFYGSSENLEMTFCSNNDCNITAEFEHFYTENNFDKLYIYDGMSVNDIWLYTCTGNTFPQSVTSSNQCLTFKFVSDYSGNYSGWKINLNCNKATITASPSAVACDGDPVNLTANQGVAYIWSTGANTQSISVVAAGNYVVTVTDENECSRPSAPVVVNINPLPPTPTISVNEGLLQATPSSGYTFKWYFNGTLISGANLSFYWPTQNGVYMVEITDQLGCSSVSAPYNVQFVGIDENVEDVFTKLYPNPLTTQTTLLINTSHSAYLHVECFDVTGKKIATIYQGNLPGGANEIDIDAQQLGLVSGTYILRILCDNQMIHHKMMISNQ